MCGFAIYRDTANTQYIKRRGQDHHGILKINGLVFEHFLLSVTGEFTPQPFIDGDIVCVYNGEIYNQSFKRSDGETIIPLYKKYGEDFVKHLDGEFAISLYDFGNNIGIFSADHFATKPIWVKDIEVASYYSGVGGDKIPANTTYIVDLKTGARKEKSVYDFSLDQHKDGYNDWIQAFEESIGKRAKDNCFIGLSSGYDSGAIDCALRKTGVSYTAYSIKGEEDAEVLRKRGGEMLDVSVSKKEIKDIAEEFVYWNGKLMTDDKAVVGLATIAKTANHRGHKVYLSGQGADEILSDYSKFPGQGQIQRFPDKLFIWDNFYGKCQKSYIAKEEHIAGAYNIETRYPFLDRQVVQEFLWLNTKMKNQFYKAPIHEYLTRNNYPFVVGEKVGFRP